MKRRGGGIKDDGSDDRSSCTVVYFYKPKNVALLFFCGLTFFYNKSHLESPQGQKRVRHFQMKGHSKINGIEPSQITNPFTKGKKKCNFKYSRGENIIEPTASPIGAVVASVLL